MVISMTAIITVIMINDNVNVYDDADVDDDDYDDNTKDNNDSKIIF